MIAMVAVCIFILVLAVLSTFQVAVWTLIWSECKKNPLLARLHHWIDRFLNWAQK
jgi:hypothetical protein